MTYRGTTYDVDELNARVSSQVPRWIPTAQAAIYLTEERWGGEDLVRSFLEHAERIRDVDASIPLLFSPDLELIDGAHRLACLLLEKCDRVSFRVAECMRTRRSGVASLSVSLAESLKACGEMHTFKSIRDQLMELCTSRRFGPYSVLAIACSSGDQVRLLRKATEVSCHTVSFSNDLLLVGSKVEVELASRVLSTPLPNAARLLGLLGVELCCVLHVVQQDPLASLDEAGLGSLLSLKQGEWPVMSCPRCSGPAIESPKFLRRPF